MMENINVSIIISAYNEEDQISECLESLLSLEYPADQYEIIVVNDGSVDRTEDIVKGYVKDHPNLFLFSKPNGGKASAQNLGLQHVKGEYIFITDSDAIVEKKWILKMLNDLETNDVVLGAYYAKKNDNWLVNVQNLHCLIKLKYGGLKGRPTIGVNNAFHRDVIKKIGYFDESKTSVTEDFIKRCEQAGLKIKFNPEIVVLTEFTKSMKGFLKQRLRWNENSITFLKDGKITVFDILGFGYGIGLSFILFASFILSVITLDYIYLLFASLGVLFVLFLFYAKPFFRISVSEDRYYAKYYAGYLLMEMILRMILFPHFVYRLIKPQNKPTFETNRN